MSNKFRNREMGIFIAFYFISPAVKLDARDWETLPTPA